MQELSLTCTTPSPAAQEPTTHQPTTKETSPAQSRYREGSAGFCRAGCHELTGIFLKIKAIFLSPPAIPSASGASRHAAQYPN